MLDAVEMGQGRPRRVRNGHATDTYSPFDARQPGTARRRMRDGRRNGYARADVAAAQYVLAQLSDSHLRAGPDGDASAAALAATVAAVQALDRPPDAVLVSGDLVDSGEPEQYARVRELLAPLPMPLHVLVGNHDDRALLRQAFDLPGRDDEPIQHELRLGPLRLLCGDTVQLGTDAGCYPPERLAWLAGALAADRETPTIVALHHPPLPIGIGGLDDLGLPEVERAALAALLAEHPQVQRVICGHVHRTVFGTVGGRPLMTCPSTYLQARLDLRVPGDIELRPETAGFALHAWLGDELVTHVQPLG
jgi:3',5'-cyclic-AMP phosphodiesterase